MPLSDDLLYYLLYSLQQSFVQTFEVNMEKVWNSPYLQSIYLYFLKEKLMTQLEEHRIEPDASLVLEKSLDGMNEYLLHKDALELAKYHDYLESWTMANPDWRLNPIPFDGFEFV